MLNTQKVRRMPRNVNKKFRRMKYRIALREGGEKRMRDKKERMNKRFCCYEEGRHVVVCLFAA